MVTVTHAKIRPDWDTSITYDVLRAREATIPVFVGRKELLQPMVASICETRKRGTILISGYRGTGKTTLLIEALRQARKILEEAPGDKKRLLPIVLNVSEVSASLEQQAEAAAPVAKAAGLSIDPKRLLIALMRSFAYQRRRSDLFAEETNKDLGALIDELYTKAVAAEFSRTSETAQDEAHTRSRDIELSLKLDGFLKAAPYLSGIAAVVFALLGWGPSPVVYKVLAAVAAIATLALSFKWKAGTKSSRSHAEKFSYKLDNSLQQIENDLKDLLEQLAEKGFRTIVVLEELDKLDHGGQQQLDAVIRYFKNLFTQAPALFFFVTDKNYFDAIAQAIRDARTRRSYAVEHTFFTNRIFVGRPVTRDCLDYINRILLEKTDRDVLDRVYTSPRFATESHGPSAPQSEPLSLFARVLLFRAANHLFDLKNELRRYVRQREDGQVVLQFDADMFPPEEQALAKFQDLVADKFRAFEIKGGRSYANEVLNDCLYAVFNQLGSASAQSIQALSPQTTHPDGAVQAVDSLDIAESLRIEQAVRSLLDDLQRGLAVSLDPAAGKFLWLTNAASVFKVVRRLEKHEDDLVAQLRSHAARLELLLSRMGGDYEDKALVEDYIARKRARADQVANVDSTIPLDAATQEQRELDVGFAMVAMPLQDAHRLQVGRLFGIGFVSEPVAHYENGSAVRLMITSDGQPRDARSSELGCVLLAQGNHERIPEDIIEFLQVHTSIRKLALVHVLPAGASNEECRSREAAYGKMAKATVARIDPDSDTSAATLPFRVQVIAQDEPTSSDPAEPWGLALGRELVLLSYWATYRDKTLLEDHRESQRELSSALHTWLSQDPGASTTCFIQGARDPKLVMQVVRRILHDYGAGAMAIPLLSATDEVFALDDQQESSIIRALQESAAPQAVGHLNTENYAVATRRLLADPAAVLMAQGDGPLFRLDTGAFSSATRVVYLGVPVPERFFQTHVEKVLLAPVAQFRTKSGVEGPGETQHLTVCWGQYHLTHEVARAAGYGAPQRATS